MVKFSRRVKILSFFLPCRFLSRSDSVTVSVWNQRKVNRREGAGFLGCVRLSPAIISRLKDTGCKYRSDSTEDLAN